LAKQKQNYLDHIEERRAQQLAYRNKNAEIIKLRNKQYLQKHRDEINERRKAARDCKKEALRDYFRKYYQQNKHKAVAYRKKNIDKIKENNARWLASNGDKNRQYEEVRRAKKKKLANTLTMHEWNQTKTYFGNSCAYCGMSEKDCINTHGCVLHQDHIVPVSNNGSYTKENIIPSCPSCNSRKRNQNFISWYTTHERYSLENMNRIISFINQSRLLEAQISREWGRNDA
jgi:hypothetical protein